MSNPLRIAAAFAASLGIYMLLAGSLSLTELGAGLAVSALVAAYIAAARHSDYRLELLRPPLRALLRPTAALAADIARVGLALFRTLLRPIDGQASWLPFRPGGDAARDAGRRAFVTLSTSLAPNGIVLDILPSALPQSAIGILVHRLVPSPPGPGADWPS